MQTLLLTESSAIVRYLAFVTQCDTYGAKINLRRERENWDTCSLTRYLIRKTLKALIYRIAPVAVASVCYGAGLWKFLWIEYVSFGNYLAYLDMWGPDEGLFGFLSFLVFNGGNFVVSAATTGALALGSLAFTCMALKEGWYRWRSYMRTKGPQIPQQPQQPGQFKQLYLAWKDKYCTPVTIEGSAE